MKRVIPGIYRHYKNELYQVIGTGRHTNTLEPLVIYRVSNIYSHDWKPFWIRPLEEFSGTVKIDGLEIQRFTFLPLYEPPE